MKPLVFFLAVMLASLQSSAGVLVVGIPDYGSVVLTDSERGLQMDLQLFTSPFTKFSYRIVSECYHQKSLAIGARQHLAGSVITDKDGRASKKRTLPQSSLNQLKFLRAGGLALYIHDHNRLRLVKCVDLFVPKMHQNFDAPWLPRLIPQDFSYPSPLPIEK